MITESPPKQRQEDSSISSDFANGKKKSKKPNDHIENTSMLTNQKLREKIERFNNNQVIKFNKGLGKLGYNQKDLVIFEFENQKGQFFFPLQWLNKHIVFIVDGAHINQLKQEKWDVENANISYSKIKNDFEEKTGLKYEDFALRQVKKMIKFISLNEIKKKRAFMYEVLKDWQKITFNTKIFLSGGKKSHGNTIIQKGDKKKPSTERGFPNNNIERTFQKNHVTNENMGIGASKIDRNNINFLERISSQIDKNKYQNVPHHNTIQNKTTNNDINENTNHNFTKMIETNRRKENHGQFHPANYTNTVNYTNPRNGAKQIPYQKFAPPSNIIRNGNNIFRYQNPSNFMGGFPNQIINEGYVEKNKIEPFCDNRFGPKRLEMFNEELNQNENQKKRKTLLSNEDQDCERKFRNIPGNFSKCHKMNEASITFKNEEKTENENKELLLQVIPKVPTFYQLNDKKMMKYSFNVITNNQELGMKMKIGDQTFNFNFENPFQLEK